MSRDSDARQRKWLLSFRALRPTPPMTGLPPFALQQLYHVDPRVRDASAAGVATRAGTAT